MSAAKVFIVDYASQADYKVYLVDSSSQQKNQGIIEGGKLVKFASQANVKLYIVKHRTEADICILQKSFPK